MEAQFKFAIDARDKLNDNFYKWMSYYYLANAAVLVAISSLYNKSSMDNGVLLFSIIGVFVCILWNLSCKGYYYWSKSWIEIIIKLERKIIENNTDLAIFSVFSKQVATKEDSVLIPNQAANISTPKLTLLFSYFAIYGWLFYSAYEFWFLFPKWPLYCKLIIILLFLLLLIIFYTTLLPKWAVSRRDKLHDLV
jgi:hypothetical protein